MPAKLNFSNMPRAFAVLRDKREWRPRRKIPTNNSLTCSHGWNTMKQASVLPKKGPKFYRHCEGYADVRYIREYSLHLLLPCFCRPLTTARAEPRFACMEYCL